MTFEYYEVKIRYKMEVLDTNNKVKNKTYNEVYLVQANSASNVEEIINSMIYKSYMEDFVILSIKLSKIQTVIQQKRNNE